MKKVKWKIEESEDLGFEECAYVLSSKDGNIGFDGLAEETDSWILYPGNIDVPPTRLCKSENEITNLEDWR